MESLHDYIGAKGAGRLTEQLNIHFKNQKGKSKMAKRKTTSEMIEAKAQKISELEAQKKHLEARKREEDRKARTKRLIEVGAEVESVLGCPIEREDLPKLRRFLQDQEARGRYFSRAMDREDADYSAQPE